MKPDRLITLSTKLCPNEEVAKYILENTTKVIENAKKNCADGSKELKYVLVFAEYISSEETYKEVGNRVIPNVSSSMVSKYVKNGFRVCMNAAIDLMNDGYSRYNISKFDINPIGIGALKNYGINTVKDLITTMVVGNTTNLNNIKIRNLGIKSIDQIETVLASYITKAKNIIKHNPDINLLFMGDTLLHNRDSFYLADTMSLLKDCNYTGESIHRFSRKNISFIYYDITSILDNISWVGLGPSILGIKNSMKIRRGDVLFALHTDFKLPDVIETLIAFPDATIKDIDNVLDMYRARRDDTLKQIKVLVDALDLDAEEESTDIRITEECTSFVECMKALGLGVIIKESKTNIVTIRITSQDCKIIL